MYSPSELADELGLNPRSIYKRYIPAGMPHVKDAAGHVWLHGPAVAQWVKVEFKAKSGKTPLKDDQAYCLRCKKAVKMIDPKRIRRGRFVLLQAVCPVCQGTINKGVKK
jgi:hypothetical protein